MNWSHGRSQSHTVQNIRNPDKSQFKGLFRNMKWIFLNKKLEPTSNYSTKRINQKRKLYDKIDKNFRTSTKISTLDLSQYEDFPLFVDSLYTETKPTEQTLDYLDVQRTNKRNSPSNLQSHKKNKSTGFYFGDSHSKSKITSQTQPQAFYSKTPSYSHRAQNKGLSNMSELENLANLSKISGIANEVNNQTFTTVDKNNSQKKNILLNQKELKKAIETNYSDMFEKYLNKNEHKQLDTIRNKNKTAATQMGFYSDYKSLHSNRSQNSPSKSRIENLIDKNKQNNEQIKANTKKVRFNIYFELFV